MKKLIIAVAGLAAFVAGPALAADMPLKAPPMPVAVSLWTGGYIGVGVGALWSNTKWNTTCFAQADPPDFGSCADPDLLDFGFIDGSGSHTFHTTAFRASLFGGYQVQMGQWVGGLEADFGWDNGSQTSAGIPGCILTGCIGNGESTRIQTLWDGSFRARLGFLVTPDVLIYGTGGFAFQTIKASVNCVDDLATTIAFACFNTASSFQHETMPGWTAGGGLEYKMGHMFFRGEYRFSSFEGRNTAFFQPDSLLAQGIHARLRTDTQMATIGFGWLLNAEPVVARY